METQVKAKPKLRAIKEEEAAQVLVAGEVGAILELTVKDKNGKVTDRRIMRSKSFVRQFLELLYVEFQKLPAKTPLVIKDTGGLGRNIWNNYENFDCLAAIGDITHGTVVGTGAVAPTINDYQLGTIILHDAAPPTAGRLQYSATTFGAPTSDATTSRFQINREFTNASGGAITVNEIGLYVRAVDNAGPPGIDRYFMIIRDVIAGGIAVANGQILTVNYREQVVV